MTTSSKKIVIEALAAGYIPCGLREYAYQVCTRLIKAKPTWLQLAFIVPKGMGGCFGEGAEYIETSKLMGKVFRNLPIIKADMFHALHQICLIKHLPGVPKQLMTIHDINFAHTKQGRRFAHAERRFLSRLQYATHLAYISRFAAEDVAKHYPNSKPYTIIYNGVTKPDVSNAKKPDNVPDTPFLLHLSSLDINKNAGKLIEMMDYLPARTLVLAGSCADESLIPLADERKNVIRLGRISEEEKAWLFKNCDAFLFPSSAEGFGLPPLEAMSFGKRVFLSILTSLPEIGGNKAYYWSDLTPQIMAKELEQKLALPYDSDAIKLHADQFKWDTTVQDYLRYYETVLFE